MTVGSPGGLQGDADKLVVTTVSWWLAEGDQGVTMSPVVVMLEEPAFEDDA